MTTPDITVIMRAERLELDGTSTGGYTVVAVDGYAVPVDPAAENYCDSCQ